MQVFKKKYKLNEFVSINEQKEEDAAITRELSLIFRQFRYIRQIFIKKGSGRVGSIIGNALGKHKIVNKLQMTPEFFGAENR